MREVTRRVRWVDPKSDHAPNRDIVGAHGRPALAPWASVRPYTSPTGFRVRGDSDSRFRSARARRPSETRPHASRKKIAADATNRHAIWARRPKVPGDLPGAPTAYARYRECPGRGLVTVRVFVGAKHASPLHISHDPMCCRWSSRTHSPRFQGSRSLSELLMHVALAEAIAQAAIVIARTERSDDGDPAEPLLPRLNLRQPHEPRPQPRVLRLPIG